MTTVQETKLPGVGVRQEFTTADGTVVGVLNYHDGRRDLLVYDTADPDRCSSILHLDDADTATLASLLGASQLTAGLQQAHQEIEGLAFEWIAVAADSPAAGRSIADGAYRQRTGSSIVAVLRPGGAVPAPGPDFQIEAGDTVVAIGTHDGVTDLRRLLQRS